jgi:hypothetical protein
VKRAQLSLVTPAPTLQFVTSVPPTLLLLLRSMSMQRRPTLPKMLRATTAARPILLRQQLPLPPMPSA